MGFRRPAGRADGQGHVGVLGVGEDEILAAVRVGVNASQFCVERFLHHDTIPNHDEIDTR